MKNRKITAANGRAAARQKAAGAGGRFREIARARYLGLLMEEKPRPNKPYGAPGNGRGRGEKFGYRLL